MHVTYIHIIIVLFDYTAIIICNGINHVGEWGVNLKMKHILYIIHILEIYIYIYYVYAYKLYMCETFWGLSKIVGINSHIQPPLLLVGFITPPTPLDLHQ